MFKLTLIYVLFIPSVAHAYLGPAIGGGIILATIGVVIAIFAAIFGILWFPLKRFLKNKKKNKKKINTPV
jgi:hypothetical protein